MGVLKFLTIGVLAAVVGTLPAGTAAQTVKTVQVLRNIYTVVPEAPDDANATFIVTGKGVIVIDTGGSRKAGQTILAEIRKVTDQPVVYILNTHYHPENTFGNGAFEEADTLIAQDTTSKLLDLLIHRGRLEKEVRLPNLVFETGVELVLGDYHLKLIHPGPGHTKGDVFVYIPSWRLIIAGGLVFNKVIPDLGDAYIDSWIDALQHMENLDAEVIVPGHGPVGHKPLVTQIKHYLMQLRTMVSQQVRAGKDLKATQDAVRPQLEALYPGWKNQDRINANITRAYIEYSAKLKS